MKHLLTITLSLACLVAARAQTPWQVAPEFTTGLPQGHFSGGTLNAGTGFGGQLHLDRLNIYKNFGLGVLGGLHSFNIDAGDYGLHPDISVLREGKANWRTGFAAIGPNYTARLSERFQLQLFSKAGVAGVTTPSYTDQAVFPDGNQVEVFSTQTPDEHRTKTHFMVQSGLRFNIHVVGGIWASAGANYTHIKDAAHVHRQPDVELDPEAPPDIQYEQLHYASVRSFRELCNLNTIGITVGLTVPIGSRRPREPKPRDPKPRKPTEPPVSREPEVPYACDVIAYRAPNNEDYVVLDSKPTKDFEWQDANSRNAKAGITYELQLYTRNEEGYALLHRVETTKNSARVNLANVEQPDDYTVYWQVVAKFTRTGEPTCPIGSKMLRLFVFKTGAEALQQLPLCKQESVPTR